jgi:ferritin-like metal-binding protein YciE
MAEINARDTKLIQYLNEAFGKEKELETALQQHIALTTRAPYKKRLQEHLKETKRHSKAVEKRIKQLGGGSVTSTATGVLTSAMALAKGPLHALRGTGEAEKMLKNAKTEYWNEHDEIAMYTAIEALAEAVGDRDTAKVAKEIRRDEEKMARYLERLMPSLAKAVAKDEIPAAERRTNGGRRRTTSSRSTASRRSTSRSSTTRSRSRTHA